MKKLSVVALLLVALAALSCVYGEDAIELTDETFQSTISSNEFVFVKFYAPWCGHCKNLAPTWEKLAAELKAEGSPVKITKIDASTYREVGAEYGVEGFPTLKLFRNGIPTDYSGGRDLASFKRWIARKVNPVQTITTVEAAKAFNNGLIGYFPSTESVNYKTFVAALPSLEFSDWAFATVSDANIAKELGLAENEIAFRSSALETSPKTQVNEDTNIISFVCSNAFQQGDEINQSVYQRLEACGRPFVLYFYNTKEEAKQFINDVASNYKSVGLAIGDGTKWGEIISRLGGSGKVVPTAVAFLPKSKDPNVKVQEHAAFNEEKPFNTENAKEFFEQVIAGKVDKFIKSEPIPEKNDGPVKIVVAKNYDAIVNDKTKDVLLEFYAPWCPHCKNLEPTYNAAGEYLKDISSVVIAKIDGTANTIPDNLPITGFPTLLFFPANNKETPIEYEANDRSLRSILQFVKDSASIKFDLDLSKLPDAEEEDEDFEDFEDIEVEDVESDEGDDEDDDDEYHDEL